MWHLGMELRVPLAVLGQQLGPRVSKGIPDLRNSMGLSMTVPAAQAGTGSCYTQIILL